MCDLRHLPAVLAISLGLPGEPGRQRSLYLGIPTPLWLQLLPQRPMQFGVNRAGKGAGPHHTDAVVDWLVGGFARLGSV